MFSLLVENDKTDSNALSVFTPNNFEIVVNDLDLALENDIIFLNNEDNAILLEETTGLLEISNINSNLTVILPSTDNTLCEPPPEIFPCTNVSLESASNFVTGEEQTNSNKDKEEVLHKNKNEAIKKTRKEVVKRLRTGIRELQRRSH
jgi:hypothetical protein